MRSTLWPLFVLLASCDGAEEQTSATAAVAPEDRVECALRESEAFVRECALELEGDLLTVRHPDGGFRRLRITDDGRGVAAADGAFPATVEVVAGNRIEVGLDGDRYRLPATVRGQ
jgi:hypothetical protein